MDYGTFFAGQIIVSDSLGNEKKCHSASNVVKGIERFVYDNYRGLAEITVDLPDDAVILISMESFGMFLKEIIDFVYGRALLKMDFYSERGKMIMYLSSNPEISCSYDEAVRFIRFARDIGLDLLRVDGRVVFIIDCRIKRNYSVYAPPVKDNAKRIAEIFENVFYKDKILEKRERKDE